MTKQEELRAIRASIMSKGLSTLEAQDVIAGILTLSPLTVKDMFTDGRKAITDNNLKLLRFELGKN